MYFFLRKICSFPRKTKKTVSSPTVDFASQIQGWNSSWFAGLAFQYNRARKKTYCYNFKFNSSLIKIYNIFSITTLWVILKKLKRTCYLMLPTKGRWKQRRFSSCAFDQNFSDWREIHNRHQTFMLCKNYFGEIILSFSEIIRKSFYRQHKVTPSLTYAWPSSVDQAKVIKRLSQKVLLIFTHKVLNVKVLTLFFVSGLGLRQNVSRCHLFKFAILY